MAQKSILTQLILVGAFFSHSCSAQDISLICTGSKKIQAFMQNAAPEQLLENVSAQYIFKNGKIIDAGEIIYSPTGRQKKAYDNCKWTADKIVCDNFDERSDRCLFPKNSTMCLSRIEIFRANGAIVEKFSLELQSDTVGKVVRTDIFTGVCSAVSGRKF